MALVFLGAYALNGIASEQAPLATVAKVTHALESQQVKNTSSIAGVIKDAKLSPLTLAESLPQPVLSAHKPLVIQFWASWCHSCGTVLWDMDALFKQFPDTQYLSVSIDKHRESAASAVEKHPLRQRYQGHFFHDSAEVLKKHFDVVSVPTIIIVDAQGAVANRHVGHLNATDRLRFVTLLESM